MQCMIYNIKSTTPNTKISQKSQKPQKFKKPQNLGLKCVVDVKKGFKNTYQVIWAWYWRRERFSVEGEKMKWDLIRVQPLNIKRSSMDRGIYQDLSSTKSWQKWICRSAVEALLTFKITLMDRESIQNLSTRQRD